MRQRRYLQNLVNSTHSSMQIEYKMKSRQKWELSCMERKRFQRETRTQTNLLQTHFFIVFDFIFRDDAVGLVGLLPGELDAALLHFLLDDLADLGWSCLDKNMSIGEGQTLSARTCIQPSTNQPRWLLRWHSETLAKLMNIHGVLLNVYTSLLKFQLQCKQRKIALP